VLLVVGAGALLITATVVGIAPSHVVVANAHEELPVVLPEFEALAQRTYVYDANGQEIAFYELENSQPIAYEDIPPAGDRRVPHRSRTRSSSTTTASTSAA
jgi:membrane carboxypeptidase/penicillin-binding protein